MYLKSLEMQGFKSMPDRTVFSFAEPITAVVGPNGSGKSNISDAIRWVVGEQSSKALRGGKMEDVIFIGTEKRKQSGYAQVSLILDNSGNLFPMDESEVMITRKYFRSGESEYFINKHQVRLRDINELFMGTGLGREGYSVIGQGKIDEILSVKSGQRREVFEEAAGIAKYRHQKEESGRKLARAEENLVRIEDKISELELQVKPLQAKSETAKKFLILRDELRVLEISLWLEQLQSVQTGKIKLRADYNQGVAERDRASQAVERLYEKVEELETQLREKAVEIEAQRQAHGEREGELTSLEAQIQVLKNNISNNQNNAKRLAESLEQRQAKEKDLSEQIQKEEEKLEQLQSRRKTVKEDSITQGQVAHQLKEEVEAQRKKLEQLRVEEQRLNQSLSSAKVQLSALTGSTQAMLDQDKDLRQELAVLEEKITTEEAQRGQQSQELDEATQGELASKNAVDGHALRVEGRQKKYDGLVEQQNTLANETNAKEAKLKMLQDMEQMYDGFSGAVKKVMNEAKRGQLKNIHGPVAELMTVPKEFTVAIETALGGAMQNIVVGNANDGKAVLSFLKRLNAGRATILPLDTMKPRFLNQKHALEKEAGFVGVASDLVGYDGRYAPVMGNLLGNVAVMEHLDCAVETARKFHHQFRIVTIDGQVLNQGGSMTGGSASRSAGILSRKDEVDTLKKQVEENRSKLVIIDQDRSDLQTLMSGAKYELQIAQEELRRFQDGILRWSGALEGTVRTLEALLSQRQGKEEQLTLLQTRNTTIDADIEQAQDGVKQQEVQVAEIATQYANETTRLSQLQAQWQEASDLATTTLSKLGLLDVEEQSVEQNKGNLQGILDDMEGERDQNSSLIEDYQAENAKYDHEIQSQEEHLEAKRKACMAQQEDIAQMVQDRLQLEALRNQTDKEGREKNNHLVSLERNVAGLEQKKNVAESEEAQLLSRLWDNYELTHEGAKELKVELESVAKANRRIGELKRDIGALGNIDIDSIEEFEKINERYTYVTEQKEDIVQAKKELEKIIAEIVKEMEGIFAQEFQRINEAFGEIFVKLFGGGQAEVFLEDTEDVLGSGIEVKAQPPGKALKVLSLLSGGEKALIAVALYFAILRIRPSPFVVMDEVEAALDEGNVDRLMQYIRQISDKTQFIMITHRRGTMEASDIMYGITMQEKGVSRMLRLSLSDLEEVEKELNMTLE